MGWLTDLLGGFGFGGSNNKATQTNEPPEYVKTRWPGLLDDSAAIAGRPAPVFGAPRVAPITPLQDTGFQMLADRALYGDPGMNAARGTMMGISQGGMMNPFMDPGYTEQMIANNARDMTNSFARGTAAQTNASAARAGGFGGSAHNQLGAIQGRELADSIGNMATNTRLGRLDQNAGLFSQDRDAMMQAAMSSLPFAQQDQSDIAGMIGAGAQQRGYGQQLLDQNYDQFMSEFNYPQEQAGWMAGLLSQAAGGYGTNISKQKKGLLDYIFG